MFETEEVHYNTSKIFNHVYFEEHKPFIRHRHVETLPFARLRRSAFHLKPISAMMVSIPFDVNGRKMVLLSLQSAEETLVFNGPCTGLFTYLLRGWIFFCNNQCQSNLWSWIYMNERRSRPVPRALMLPMTYSQSLNGVVEYCLPQHYYTYFHHDKTCCLKSWCKLSCKIHEPAEWTLYSEIEGNYCL